MTTPNLKMLAVICSAAMLLPVSASAKGRQNDNIVGDVRVQFLSPTLVRLELKGRKGFEDRNTFTVVKRPRALDGAERNDKGNVHIFKRGHVEVVVIDKHSLKGTVVNLNGKEVFASDGTPPKPAFFPAPGAMPAAIAIADNPRIVPPKWGATAPPSTSRTNKTTSGWDISNQSADIYVFMPNGYDQFRKEFLALTGPTEMPPLYDFGLWHSRYHPYSDQEALDVIDRYRKDDIPIDNFVVDTDWRIGASHGYAVNTKLFPDMKRFIDDAHARHVRLMYNDHPEPKTDAALDPIEMVYRQEGLASLLKMGADVWWYDRNWSTHLHEPAPGLPKEVWGAAVFHDITQQVNPEKRPLIMSNVPGIDNGQRHYAPHPAAHRYPVWWTGDTSGNFDFLRNGVANAVDGGVESLLPYMSEDLGGHFGNPTPEVYERFIQYGALSPMMRLHCTAGETRDPWAFGEDVEEIVREYTKLRYRLLPTIYSAARRNYEDGTPILRRCDLEWPNEKEASRNDQYLLGDDILVAPILSSMEPQASVIPADLFHTADGKKGIKGEYFANKELKGNPAVTRIDSQIDFDWGDNAAVHGLPDDNFSVRWSGKLGPVLRTGDYQLATVTDDGVRVWINGKPVIDRFVDMDHQQSSGTVHLEAGKAYDLRMEYFDSGGQAAAHLKWLPPGMEKKDCVTRETWLPPGKWVDLWAGTVEEGPGLETTAAPRGVTPIWARENSVILCGPEMQYTGEHPWDPITINGFVGEDGTSSQILYEDDGTSNDYKSGRFLKTKIEMSRKGNELRIRIHAATGKGYAGQLAGRSWVGRIHFPFDLGQCDVTEGADKIKFDVPEHRLVPTDMPIIGCFPLGQIGDVFEGTFLAFDLVNKPISQERTIIIRFQPTATP